MVFCYGSSRKHIGRKEGEPVELRNVADGEKGKTGNMNGNWNLEETFPHVCLFFFSLSMCKRLECSYTNAKGICKS